jgi:hypothetical protein
MTGKIIFVLALIAAAVLAQASRSVWDSVYTDGQAKRGQALFEQNCVSGMERHPHCQVVNRFGRGAGNR